MKQDTIKNAIANISKEVQPLLYISGDAIIETNNDKRCIKYTMGALNSEAYIIRSYYVYFNIVGANDKGEMLIDSPGHFIEGASFHPSIPIIPTEGKWCGLFLDRQYVFSQNFFLVIHFDYRSNDGKIQRPFQSIYKITKTNMREAFNDEHHAINRVLETQKLVPSQ